MNFKFLSAIHRSRNDLAHDKDTIEI